MNDVDLTVGTPTGQRLAATLTLPDGDGPHPAVLLCQGLSGVRHLVLPEVAERFADAGLATIRFDYLGYGDSEGERGWIDPIQRVRDARLALEVLVIRPEVDASRVGVYGHSYGGPVAVHVAAQDLRVRALVAVSSPGGGPDMLRAPRPAWEWIELRHRVDNERARIADGQPPTAVDVSEIFPFSPAFEAAYARLKAAQGGTSAQAAGDGLGTTRFYLASIDRMMEFDPAAAARRLGHCPALFIHGTDDDTAPIETLAPVVDAVPGVVEWHLVAGADHNALDGGPGLVAAATRAADWFTHHLA